MSENRKYYYMKLKENFFTDVKMVILESMQDGDRRKKLPVRYGPAAEDVSHVLEIQWYSHA